MVSGQTDLVLSFGKKERVNIEEYVRRANQRTHRVILKNEELEKKRKEALVF